MPALDTSVLAATLPNTDYFEMHSSAAGDDYAIWVTRPAGYDEDRPAGYPAIYVTDGNTSAAQLGPLVQLLCFDAIEPHPAYLQVSVGYPPDRAEQAQRLRTRDLIPPGEPFADSYREFLELVGRPGEMLADARADAFLEFLETELRPAIEDRYRVEPGTGGLFGYSFGGLFSLYALLRRTPMFTRYGAGSPAILTPESRVFALESELREAGIRFDDVRLHITLSELEITGSVRVYRDLESQVGRMLDRLRRNEGLALSTRVLPDETHVTGVAPSFLSFIRSVYSLSQAAS